MLARLHSFLGVVLSVYLLVHVYEHWPALQGREAWVTRALHSLSYGLALGLVLPLLVAHAALGWLRFWGLGPSAGPTTRAAGANERGLLRLQAASGALVFMFVAYHVASFWSLERGPNSDERAPYALLWRTLGEPFVLALYLAGSAATCFHMAHGLLRLFLALGFGRSARALLALRLLAGAFGFLVFGLLLDLIGHFALGAPVF
jgi:succinate dehydrogenase/fumarate reductase cytochrome b subunit